MDRQQFVTFFPGRVISFTYPVTQENGIASICYTRGEECNGKQLCGLDTESGKLTFTVSVLDAPASSKYETPCAALLVPEGMEEDWIYTRESGQLQLLASAKVRRLIIFCRGNFIEANLTSDSKPPNSDTIKSLVGPMVLALSPKVCFDAKPVTIPFVSYSDGVLQRRVLEMVDSPISGGILVEDVEVFLDDTEPINDASNSLQNRQTALRRRLRFERMPNLIQSEVALLQDERLPQPWPSSALKTELCLLPDLSSLVHKYLPPIIAGLCLLHPNLRCGQKTAALVLGGGAFTLPLFLAAHLRCSVQAVELDPHVVRLARKHFGLHKGSAVRVRVGDAELFVKNLSRRVQSKRKAEQRECTSGKRKRQPDDKGSSRVKTQNVCFAVVVLDIDCSDSGGLCSPPPSLCSTAFLRSLRSILLPHGVLAMNVLPACSADYAALLSRVKEVFGSVFELGVLTDDNKVVFAQAEEVQGWNSQSAMEEACSWLPGHVQSLLPLFNEAHRIK